MSGLNKEVWINQVMERFYPDSSFLKYGRDMSQFVDNDKINLADAGVDPEVLINNTTYPIKVEERTDKPISIELDVFETINTVVRRMEDIELAYDKVESVIQGHRNALQAKCGMKAAHAYAPTENTEFTPVIETTGDVAGDRKRLCYRDIITLKEAFDGCEIPLEDRFLVLDPKHVSDLLLEDIKLFKNLTNLQEGKPFNFAGFNMLQFSKMPKYAKTNGKWVKAAFGALNGTNFSSFAFQAKEVMKADGNLFMYAKENDPEQRGTIIGFDKRFIALPIRNVGIGAIVSAPAMNQ